MIKAIVFDFDGVIVDSEKVRYDAWQAVFSQYGKTLPLDEWIKNIGRARYVADPHLILQELTGIKIHQKDAYSQAKKFEMEYIANAPALPGVKELITQAYHMRIPVAIASSSTRAWVEGQLNRLSIIDMFTTLVCREDTSKHKPSPDPYLTAINRIGCLPHEAIAIEDSPLGIQSANSAGLKCVAVGCSITKHLDLSKAMIQLSSLLELNLNVI